ncbi:hypothetical protein GDO78_008746 [Eleutherodactylus coqui]|uniref:Uncharacterized protein n=1 Tax=Eleutherodactylus coqui TaxID=57060 RepID=A0A8J6FE46_ELECQ|nr:hypothetical protein GDO78_008746 [Eleutherodactylus coqui]
MCAQIRIRSCEGGLIMSLRSYGGSVALTYLRSAYRLYLKPHELESVLCVCSVSPLQVWTQEVRLNAFFFLLDASPHNPAQFPEAIKLVCTWQSVTAISCEM